MSKQWTKPMNTPPIKKEMNAHLEGPKKKHDDHGPYASVPGKGVPVPAEHWERHYSLSEPSKTMKVTGGADFNAKCPEDRKTTHLKVNKTDH